MEEQRPVDDVEMEESEGSKQEFSGSEEESEWEEQSDSEDRAFCVDEELDESDADDDVQSRIQKVGNDHFLYDICHVPVSQKSVEENVDKEVIREDGLSDEEGEMEIQMEGDPDDDEAGPKFSTHDPTISWKLMKPHLGERFPNKEQLRFCLANYAVANGYPIKVVKSASDYIQVKCGTDKKGNQCPYKLWASWMNKEQSFQIKAIDERHSCIREYRHATLVNPTWIATHYLKKLSSNPKMKGREIQAEIKRKFLCEVSKEQCYRAKKQALEIINGKLTEHYARIWDYAHEIIRSNPGSTAQVGVSVNPDGKTYFHRFYVCFKAVKDGWSRGCRRVIGLDGCFLKGQCKGELLTAIGRDGNNQVYPIAWAVVDVENRANWEWFMALLVEDLGLQLGGGLTILSDQHKGLVEAAKKVLPVVEHRQCARHVYANFKKVYNGVDYKRLFWAASTSSHEAGHNEAMQELRCINKSAYEYLLHRQPHSWSRAFFAEDRACEAVENGISESFNSIILEARTKPLLTMLEEIRMYVMARFCRMATKHLSWTEEVCPTILKKLDKWTEDIRFWVVVPSEATIFEVRHGFDAFHVDVESRFCTCRLWEISGIPCVHAAAALQHIHEQPKDYINPYFSKERFVQTYQGNIRPMNGSKMWPITPYTKPLPPMTRKLPGRPPVKRKRHATEDDGGYKRVRATGGTKVCQNCWEDGHNKRTCKNPTKPPPPKEKKKMGRPCKGGPTTETSNAGTSTQRTYNATNTQRTVDDATTNGPNTQASNVGTNTQRTTTAKQAGGRKKRGPNRGVGGGTQAGTKTKRKVTEDVDGGLEGLNEGLDEGLNEGLNEGLDEGLEEGLNEGLNEGVEEGVGAGFNEGLNEGQNESLEGAAVDDGFVGGVHDSVHNEDASGELHSVELFLTIEGHNTAMDLHNSGYSKAEILSSLKVPVEVDVEPIGSNEALAPLEDQAEQEPSFQEEDHVDQTPDVILETKGKKKLGKATPSKTGLKLRKKSERIIKARLGQRKDGPGSASVDPLRIE